MGRTYARKRRSLTQAQKDALVRAREAYQLKLTAHKDIKKILHLRRLEQEAERQQNGFEIYKEKAKHAMTRYWSLRRQVKRLEEKDRKRKEELRKVKDENTRLRQEVARAEKEVQMKEEDIAEVMGTFHLQLAGLSKERVELRHERSCLKKKVDRLFKMQKAMQARAHQGLIRGQVFKLTHKGIYTKQAREIARYLASTGTAEKNVGKAIAAVGKMMGMEVNRVMSKRTVQRAILESGVANEIQSGYEMAKSDKLTYSSDSTSHKHIEYESRTVAVKVVDYTKPEAEPTWKMRTLGIGTSVNHAAETQFEGLRTRLTEIAEVFNNSPLAKRESLKFNPDDFAFKLVGTSGDHAADQKKVHKLMQEWKIGVVYQRLGEEALFGLNHTQVVAYLWPMKKNQIEQMGGYAVWEKLTEDEKTALDTKILREVGRLVLEALPEVEKKQFMRFVRTGCCMHKDLNTVKGGDRAMQEMWKEKNKAPPVLLANKDNAAVLEGATDPSALSAAENRAVEQSKRGGSHAAMLGGLICRNKDKKKGQQNTYNWFMEKQIGRPLPYPDVSNTRYGSHGAAAVILIIWLLFFILFIESIRLGKDKPALTNIEKNFKKSLEDIPTLTELCVLAMYNINVSRPFMQHVRTHDNLLQLGPFFEKKRTFLKALSEDPTLWTREDVSHSMATLDGSEWDEEGACLMKAVQALAPDLPDLNNAVAAFARGAFETFSERFSDEFLEGGDIATMSAEEREELFFAATNDINEGALGSWRLGQRMRPNETLHKFTAGFATRQNDTEEFHRQKLNTEEDERYLRKVARKRDEEKLQQKVKEAQIKADALKATENREKEAVRKEKHAKKAATIAETGNHLIFDHAVIDKANVDTLNRQLDWHRENEKKVPELSERVPLKSHMANQVDRRAELKKALERYTAVPGLAVSADLRVDVEDIEMEDGEGEDVIMYMSDYEDDMI